MVEQLPHLNVALNGASLVLLIVGRRFARVRRIRAHRRCMLSAFACSIAFLVSYLTRMALGGHQPYPGAGWDRIAYLVLLGSHVVLAASVPFLALRTLYLGLRGRVENHRRWARVTFPIWAYVSATGVVIYGVLFRPFGA